MDLHSDKEIFKELIALAADHFGKGLLGMQNTQRDCFVRI